MKEKISGTAKPVHKPIKKILISVGSIIVLVLLAVAFLFDPTMFSSSNQTMPELGSYNGKKIEYTENFVNLVEYYETQLQYSNPQGSTLFSAINQAFNYTLLTLAFVGEVESTGYIVPNTLANREMLPYFYDATGTYSALQFRNTSDTQKLQIKDEVETNIKRSLYYTDMSSVKSLAAEIDFISDMNTNQRAFNMVSFNTADYPQSEIGNFALANPELFRQYNMSVITVGTETEATTIANQIKNNELTFQDAVKTYSINQYGNETGVLNNKLHYELKNIVKNEVAFNELIALESGTVSDVIETSSGFSVFAVTAPAQDADFTNTATLNQVLSYMNIYEVGIIEDYFINVAKDFSASALVNGFNSAVSEYGLTNIEVPAFPLNYGNVQPLGILPSSSVTQLANASANENFFRQAFSLAQGGVSEPIVLGNNIIVLSLASETTLSDEENTISTIIPFYLTQFDSTDIQSHFIGSDKAVNNVLSVFLQYFL
ncbi:MAG: peptidylprolyl isomerase [Spirochaetales bacterium]